MFEIAVDYGRKRTGFAICLSGVVLPQDPMEHTTWTQIAEKIRTMQNEHGYGTVILGLPLSAAGRQTDLSKEVEQLAEFLREEGFNVELMRETGSTIETLHNQMRDKRDGRRDSLAAAVILKRYLELP